jgi:hypothetical protein
VGITVGSPQRAAVSVTLGQGQCQVYLVWDDGESLSPGPIVQPMQLSNAAECRRFLDTLPAEIAKVEASVNAEPEATTTT